MVFSNKNRRIIKYKGVPYQSGIVLVLMLVISLLIHLSSYIKISDFSKNATPQNKNNKSHKNIVQVKIRNTPKTSEESSKDDQKLSKILETKLEKTDKPEKSRYLGYQDHKTEKETKNKKLKETLKGLDPGSPGNAQHTTNMEKPRNPTESTHVENKRPRKENLDKIMGITSDDSSWQIPRNPYEKMIPTSSDLALQMKAGYQDYIDEDLDSGDRVDLNTSDYRLIGYFTTLRKAFELVWNYPSIAVRQGWQGVVSVEFTIQKDGSLKNVRVVQSSGYQILDQSVVDALVRASPYSPLPKGINKDKLKITGNFRYILSNYATGY